MNEKKNLKNGLTSEQWLALWEEKSWRTEVVRACHAVATSEHVEAHLRAQALDIWGQMIAFGLASDAEVDSRTYPEIIRDVQIQIIRGRSSSVDERVRDDLAERLEGVKFAISLVSQFLPVGLGGAVAKVTSQNQNQNDSVSN